MLKNCAFSLYHKIWIEMITTKGRIYHILFQQLFHNVRLSHSYTTIYTFYIITNIYFPTKPYITHQCLSFLSLLCFISPKILCKRFFASLSFSCFTASSAFFLFSCSCALFRISRWSWIRFDLWISFTLFRKFATCEMEKDYQWLLSFFTIVTKKKKELFEI